MQQSAALARARGASEQKEAGMAGRVIGERNWSSFSDSKMGNCQNKLHQHGNLCRARTVLLRFLPVLVEGKCINDFVDVGTL